MKINFVRKWNNTKGSSLPEALIGFLIAVLTSMILVGVVTTSGNIMISGQAALDTVYCEQRAMDVFVHHDYNALSGTGTGIVSFRSKVSDEEFNSIATCSNTPMDPNAAVITLNDVKSAADGGYDPVEVNVVYCGAKKHQVLCFTTIPEQIVK